MRIEKCNNAAEARLFNLICNAIEPLLKEHAPLYAVKQVGIGRDFNSEDITLKIHLSQTASVRLCAESTANAGMIELQKGGA